ncbi:MAG: hypothetical protein HQ582_31615, partial [Planctomycetes bacterium]|nr:hypothetical protein [Planctomycetota bacterium]
MRSVDESNAGGEMTAESSWKRRPAAIAAVALVCLVAVTFFPVPGFEFVGYDVRVQVVDNPALRGMTVENVKHVFTSRCITSYYPVRTFTYMVDCQVWGLRAGGLKFTNCLIHVANVLLLFWLALRLLRHPNEARTRSLTWWEAAVAGFPAGLFAVHPVVVEPVVLMSGREELLMTLGALGTIHLHVTARRLGEKGGRTRRAILCHVAAAFCCAAACLSNAVAAAVPALVTAWDVLYLSRPKFRRILYGTATLWIIGAATIVVKRAGEVTGVVGQPDLLSADRLMLVANVYWLNLQTLLCPTRLGFGYPMVAPESFLDAEVLLGLIAIGLTLVALWTFRRRTGVLFGLLWFTVALAPSSQVMAHHIHRADRFLYLPLAGLVLALTVGWGPLASRLRRPAAAVGALALGAVVLIALETLATSQVWTWKNEITACENSLELDPTSPEARCALADRLVVHGQYRRAAETYREAMRRHPDDARIQSNYAWLLATCDDREVRDHELAVELAARACRLSQWKVPGFLMVLAKVHFNVAEELAGQGESDRAAAFHRKGVDEMLRMAILLQSDSRGRLEDPDEAVRVAERAC